MCDEAKMNIAAAAEPMPPQSKYRVTAYKSSSFNEGYDTLEEATEALVRLAGEGYTSISLHDTEDSELW